MKGSNIIIILILIVSSVTAFYVIQNNEKTVFDFHTNGVYDDKGRLKTFGQDKADASNRILLKGGIAIVLLLIFYFYTADQESKVDPIKNLESLKNNSIITNEEFDNKVFEAKNLKQKAIVDKERKKIQSELENLKTKGIINESEYLEKVKMIQDKFKK